MKGIHFLAKSSNSPNLLCSFATSTCTSNTHTHNPAPQNEDGLIAHLRIRTKEQKILNLYCKSVVHRFSDLLKIFASLLCYKLQSCRCLKGIPQETKLWEMKGETS